jgi:hypothetical protein
MNRWTKTQVEALLDATPELRTIVGGLRQEGRDLLICFLQANPPCDAGKVIDALSLVMEVEAEVSLIEAEGGLIGKSEGNPIPPTTAEFAAALFIRPKLRDPVLGDRAEQFGRDVARFGRRRAVCLYWRDVVVSLGPSLWSLIKRVGGIAIVADMYRRARGL